MSAGHPPIIAIVMAMLVLPIVSHHHLLGHRVRVTSMQPIGCNLGLPIADTPEARRLGVVSRLCDGLIVKATIRRATMVICPKHKLYRHGRCITRR